LHVVFVELVPTIKPFEEGNKFVDKHFYCFVQPLLRRIALLQESDGASAAAASAQPRQQHKK
jgi:hypothetical protein